MLEYFSFANIQKLATQILGLKFLKDKPAEKQRKFEFSQRLNNYLCENSSTSFSLR